ncbi:MAG: hypothetical protein JSR67_14395 [Proteobacteria bacterium]|nr:hypothetical protein [Pseudomonadota bacterium]
MNTNRIVTLAAAAFLGCALFKLSACSAGVPGTYTDANGAVILELRSGGDAQFTFMGDVEHCRYSSSGTVLTLNCKGDLGTVAFNLHDDGSLTGPPGSFMPPLRKVKT